MSLTVIVAEDEPHLREAVVEYLCDAGLRAAGAGSGAELKAAVARAEPDVVVLDIAMPGEDGLALARWLRTRGARVGIIFATAAADAAHRVAGLEIGADDYVAKPYELRELLARVRSVARRLPTAAPRPVPVPTFAVGGLVLDPERRALADAAGRAVVLTPMEMDLLIALVARPRRVLTRSQLLTLARVDREGDDADRSIDVRIARLRRKVEDGAEPALIQTVHGQGYTFVPRGG